MSKSHLWCEEACEGTQCSTKPGHIGGTNPISVEFETGGIAWLCCCRVSTPAFAQGVSWPQPTEGGSGGSPQTLPQDSPFLSQARQMPDWKEVSAPQSLLSWVAQLLSNASPAEGFHSHPCPAPRIPEGQSQGSLLATGPDLNQHLCHLLGSASAVFY